MRTDYIVFTDMDGTLLNHHDYRHDAADAMLKCLRQKQIPVIPNTSKTYAELICWREELQLDTPFIIENGAAIYFPSTGIAKQQADALGMYQHDGFYVKAFVSKKEQWSELLEKIANNLEDYFPKDMRINNSLPLFEHYSAMSIKRISEVTGLSAEDAQRSKSRYYTEPVLWHGNEAQKKHFIDILTRHGVSPLIGGRFIHAIGDTDKGKAMRWLMSFYQQQMANYQMTNKLSKDKDRDRDRFISIALGDSHNDVAMLEAADIAVRILSPVHSPPDLLKTQNVFTSQKAGAAGWAEMLDKIVFGKH